MQGSFKILTIFFGLFAVLHINAQIEPPTIMPGLAPTYSDKFNTGINARLYYAADHHYCFGPEVSYFKTSSEEKETSLFEANINLHYILELGNGFGFYPLGGINYSVETEEYLHATETEHHTEDAFGLNAGAGFHYAIGKIIFFAEYKYLISELEDYFFTAGALFTFSLSKNINNNINKH